jgi:hypothetical protein
MRSTLVAAFAFTAALALAAPVWANHDNGNGRSQDHLHRQNPGGPPGGGPTVSATEPLTAGLVGLGLAAAALARRRGRKDR